MAQEPHARNIWIGRVLEGQIEDEAGRLGLSFSAFVRLLAQQYFDGIHFDRKAHEVAGQEPIPARKP